MLRQKSKIERIPIRVNPAGKIKDFLLYICTSKSIDVMHRRIISSRTFYLVIKMHRQQCTNSFAIVHYRYRYFRVQANIDIIVEHAHIYNTPWRSIHHPRMMVPKPSVEDFSLSLSLSLSLSFSLPLLRTLFFPLAHLRRVLAEEKARMRVQYISIS